MRSTVRFPLTRTTKIVSETKSHRIELPLTNAHFAKPGLVLTSSALQMNISYLWINSVDQSMDQLSFVGLRAQW